jgi:hypothetical protein
MEMNVRSVTILCAQHSTLQGLCRPFAHDYWWVCLVPRRRGGIERMIGQPAEAQKVLECSLRYNPLAGGTTAR